VRLSSPLSLSAAGPFPDIGSCDKEAHFIQQRTSSARSAMSEVPGAHIGLTIDAAIEDIAAQLPPPPADVDDPFLQAVIGFRFNPLTITQEGRITVSAIKVGKRYGIGSLRVRSLRVILPKRKKPPTEAALLLFSAFDLRCPNDIFGGKLAKRCLCFRIDYGAGVPFALVRLAKT